MLKKIFIRNPEGLRLSTILHIPEKPKEIGVILCHGFTGSKDKNFIPELALELEKQGFLTLRFDFSGNGESEGKFEDRTYTKYVEDLKSVIEWFRSKVNKICVIGHSMGGSIAIIEYSKYKNFDKLVLLAPGIKSARKDIPKESFKGDYVEFVDSWGVKRRLKIEYFEDRRRYDQIKLADSIKIPTLVIIGSEDNVVSVEKCKEFFDRLKV